MYSGMSETKGYIPHSFESHTSQLPTSNMPPNVNRNDPRDNDNQITGPIIRQNALEWVRTYISHTLSLHWSS